MASGRYKASIKALGENAAKCLKANVRASPEFFVCVRLTIMRLES